MKQYVHLKIMPEIDALTYTMAGKLANMPYFRMSSHAAAVADLPHGPHIYLNAAIQFQQKERENNHDVP